jgi:hypothetical protein
MKNEHHGWWWWSSIEKGVNYTFSDNALISAINLHTHTHRTKTTAATKTASTISHARNRHLIVPSRTSRQRFKKEKKMKEICTDWYKTNWSSNRKDNDLSGRKRLSADITRFFFLQMKINRSGSVRLNISTAR